ncbi:hypothetical protein AB0D59_25310, partial [Streptomyces sp. NPDC048417]|uniref:hypothetical protein n=1 Tax=Streptomyces sp. NPDC048417 TaxID=3155387 RepID=UPI003439A878
AVETAEGTEVKPRRTRKTAAAVTAEIPAQASGEPEVKPGRRTTRKAAEPAATVDATDAEAKPKARRTRKAAAAAPEA